MPQLDDKELRLVRFILNHKEIGSKAADFLNVEEEEILKLIENLQSKALITPIIVSVSPQMYLKEIESLNVRYVTGTLDMKKYKRS